MRLDVILDAPYRVHLRNSRHLFNLGETSYERMYIQGGTEHKRIEVAKKLMMIKKIRKGQEEKEKRVAL